MDLKGVIFDVDGTLGDTLPVCISACRSAFFVATGRSYRDEEIEATFGPTEDGIVRRVAGDRWKEAWEAFLEEYYRSHEICGEPFFGMKAALRMLKER
jgi:phosphoglycolate phosphatase-like HAD superfamily hydrolase